MPDTSGLIEGKHKPRAHGVMRREFGRNSGGNPRPTIGIHLTAPGGRQFSFCAAYERTDPRVAARIKAQELGMRGQIKVHVVYWSFVAGRYAMPGGEGWMTPRLENQYRTEINIT